MFDILALHSNFRQIPRTQEGPATLPCLLQVSHGTRCDHVAPWYLRKGAFMIRIGLWGIISKIWYNQRGTARRDYCKLGRRFRSWVQVVLLERSSEKLSYLLLGLMLQSIFFRNCHVCAVPQRVPVRSCKSPLLSPHLEPVRLLLEPVGFLVFPSTASERNAALSVCEKGCWELKGGIESLEPWSHVLQRYGRRAHQLFGQIGLRPCESTSKANAVAFNPLRV